MSPIRFNSERAAAERLAANDASSSGPAAIHIALAEMHEQSLALDINDALAPLDGLARFERVCFPPKADILTFGAATDLTLPYLGRKST